MGLTCHFEIGASAEHTPEQLEEFLKTVDQEALNLGFKPTSVLNVPFDTEERRQFARRLTTGHLIQSEKLKGVVLLGEGQVFTHSALQGDCRLIPEHGVILVVTDEHRCETIFGFFRYPTALKDVNGRNLLSTGLGRDWFFRDSFKSPDPRFRKLLRKFAAADYLKNLEDDFSR